MALKHQVERLEKARLSESEIVQVLGITHLAYRRSTTVPAERLPRGARAELYYSDIRQDLSLKALAKLYRTTYSQMHTALYNKPTKKREYSHNLALAHLQEHDSITQLAEDFGISKKALPHVLKELGWHTTEEPVPLVSPLAKSILNLITQYPEFTYEQIADEAGCHRTYVTAVAKSHGIHRQEQRQQDWPKILQYASNNSIVATAAHFGISRASIYYHMKRVSNEAENKK